MTIGLLGKKVGMSRLFTEKGEAIGVTMIKAGPCYVIQQKTISKDGYNSLQIGFEEKREKLTTRPLLGHFKKAKLPPLRFVREFRVEEEEFKKFVPGTEIKVDLFKIGEKVDITGTTIGKGFQGVVKRWGFKSGPATHGSMSHRAPGSIGHTDVARVLKGTKMSGHMGARKEIISHLEVIRVDAEKNLLVVKGAVSGSKNGYLIIKKSK
ncbi:MAG: 50S ribosomal protein L3 [Candidatus Omnitrophica bacterium]|nr:50S ribosomal protein L3 [Candidatus Omnitrophota bacterium]